MLYYIRVVMCGNFCHFRYACLIHGYEYVRTMHKKHLQYFSGLRVFENNEDLVYKFFNGTSHMNTVMKMYS